MSTYATKVAKNLSNKYSQKLLDNTKKSTTDAIQSIQKTAQTTGDLIGNTIVDKITSISKQSSRELQNNEANNEIEIPKEKYISTKKDIMLLMNYDYYSNLIRNIKKL